MPQCSERLSETTLMYQANKQLLAEQLLQECYQVESLLQNDGSDAALGIAINQQLSALGWHPPHVLKSLSKNDLREVVMLAFSVVNKDSVQPELDATELLTHVAKLKESLEQADFIDESIPVEGSNLQWHNVVSGNLVLDALKHTTVNVRKAIKGLVTIAINPPEEQPDLINAVRDIDIIGDFILYGNDSIPLTYGKRSGRTTASNTAASVASNLAEPILTEVEILLTLINELQPDLEKLGSDRAADVNDVLEDREDPDLAPVAADSWNKLAAAIINQCILSCQAAVKYCENSLSIKKA